MNYFNKNNSSFLKIFSAASLGNILEFYDFATYSFLIPIIAPLFFPASDPINSLLLAFGAFAISFLARPVGGILFGYMGDIYDRKTSFALSLMSMAIATTAIGLLPTYEQVGIVAPILLVFFRLVQGICMGGEFSGSLIVTTDHLSEKSLNGALSTSCVTAAGVGGWFLSSLVCTFSINLGYSFSWRIPFLTGAVVGIVGCYIRYLAHIDSVPFEKSTESFWKILKLKWVTIVAVAGIGVLMGGLFYGLHIFPNSFLPEHFSSMSHLQALRCTTIGIGVYMILLPFMGVFADRIGVIKCMRLFCLLTIIFSYLIIWLLMSGQFYFVVLSEVLASFLLAGFMAPATLIMTQSFEPSFRYRFVSLSYNLGASLIGGITPGIFLFLTKTMNWLYGPGVYLVICGFFGLLSSYHLEQQYKRFSYFK